MGIRILVPRPRRPGAFLRANKLLWLAGGIFLWGAAYTLFGEGGMVSVLRAEAEVEELGRAVEAARQENAQLALAIHELESDPQTIERHARERLFLARPGEKVYLLPPLPELQTTSPDEPASPEPGPTDQ